MKRCFHAVGANFDATASREGCPLEIWLTTASAGWIELGSANTVRVASTDVRSFVANWARFHAVSVRSFMLH